MQKASPFTITISISGTPSHMHISHLHRHPSTAITPDPIHLLHNKPARISTIPHARPLSPYLSLAISAVSHAISQSWEQIGPLSLPEHAQRRRPPPCAELILFTAPCAALRHSPTSPPFSLAHAVLHAAPSQRRHSPPAYSWSMEPPPATLRDFPSLIPSRRGKPSTVAIVLIIVSLVFLSVTISSLVRCCIRRGCSSRSPGVAPLPEVELA